ncbi:MAG: hypothetical protein RLN90_08495 [Balneolaceae bacterium]
MKEIDSTKFAEHLRTIHFSLVAISLLILISAVFSTETSTEKAINELNFGNDLLAEWDAEYLHDQVFDHYKTEVDSTLKKMISGELVIGYESSNNFENKSFIPEDRFPLIDVFELQKTTILSQKLLEQWKKLEMITDTYPVPEYDKYGTLIDGLDVYRTRNPLRFHLEKPNTLPELHDFWNILSLDNEFIVANTSKKTTGIIYLTKYIGRYFSKVEVSFLDDVVDCREYYYFGNPTPPFDRVYCDWRFSGSIQPKHNISFELGSIYEKYPNSISTIDSLKNILNKGNEDNLVFLSLMHEFSSMAALGNGWIDELDDRSISKDFSVDVEIFIPTTIDSYSFHQQGVLLSNLPDKYPNKDIFVFGSFSESFPELNNIIERVGGSNLQDVALFLNEKRKEELSNERIEALGMKIPMLAFNTFGGVIITLMLLYFFLNLSNLNQRLQSKYDNGKVWDIPWLGLYPESFTAKSSVFLSVCLFPLISIFTSVYKNQINWYVYIIMISVFILSGFIAIKLFKFWSLSKSKKNISTTN